MEGVQGEGTPSGTPSAVPRTYSDALAALAGRQKTAKGAPAYSRYINRWFGRRLAAGAYVLGLTPNGVTAISACFTFSAILLLALLPASMMLGITVALLLLVGYALDSADGQLARLRGGGSPAGEWLDHVVDAVKTATLHAAVLLSMVRALGEGIGAPLLVPLGYGVVATVWFFAVLLTDQLRRTHTARLGLAMPSASTPAPVWRSLAALPTDFGALCLVFLLLGAPRVFLGVYGLFLVGTLLFLVAALPAWYREMASFATGPARPAGS